MENNLSASEQLALLQPTAAGPTPEETAASRVRNFVPPSVSGARAELNQVQNLIRDAESRRLNTGENISAFRPGLSASQLFADERAAQDRMITDAYARAGVPLSNADFRNLQTQIRSGTLTGENVQEKVVNPILEQRVANAYKAIGRTGPIVPLADIQAPGATADTFKSVDREGFDYFLNKLKSGAITGDQFERTFLNAAAATPMGPTAALSLDATNRARTLLGQQPLTAAQLAAAQAPGTTPAATTQTAPVFTPTPSVFLPPPGVFANTPGVFGIGQNQGILGMGTPAVTPAAAAPAPGAAVTPVNFFEPRTPTQLF